MPQMKEISFFLLSLLLPVILVSANKTFVSLTASVLHCLETQELQKGFMKDAFHLAVSANHASIYL